MKNTIIYDGIEFHQRPDTKYYRSSKHGLLHRYKWTKERWEIPENCVIHHKDEDPGNNNISNLQLLTWGEHSILHQTGRIYSEETKQKMSKSMTGKERSEAHRKALSISMKGRKISEETKVKLSIASAGRGKSKQHAQNAGKGHWKRVLCVDTGIIYESVTSAIKKTGILHISTVARGIRNKAGGYHWKYI